MATYYLTTSQLTRLLTSRQFLKRRLYLSTSHIDKRSYEIIFNSKETIAYSYLAEIQAGDKLLFTDHLAQCKALAEVVTQGEQETQVEQVEDELL